MEPTKGHRYLFGAHSQLRGRYPRLRCLVVGDGRDRDDLRSEVARLGLDTTVHFTGFRHDVPDLLREGDLLCLPSLSEGLPYALLEAAALGLPMLVSGVGDMGALLTHDKTARLVVPGDSGALARELSWFMDHLVEAAAIGRAARELVRTHLSVARMIGATLDAYAAAVTSAGARQRNGRSGMN